MRHLAATLTLALGLGFIALAAQAAERPYQAPNPVPRIVESGDFKADPNFNPTAQHTKQTRSVAVPLPSTYDPMDGSM